MARERAQRFDRLVALVMQHPGRDAAGLRALGYRPQSHGALIEAEDLGLIEYRSGGWYAAPREEVR